MSTQLSTSSAQMFTVYDVPKPIQIQRLFGTFTREEKTKNQQIECKKQRSLDDDAVPELKRKKTDENEEDPRTFIEEDEEETESGEVESIVASTQSSNIQPSTQSRYNLRNRKGVAGFLRQQYETEVALLKTDALNTGDEILEEAQVQNIK